MLIQNLYEVEYKGPTIDRFRGSQREKACCAGYFQGKQEMEIVNGHWGRFSLSMMFLGGGN